MRNITLRKMGLPVLAMSVALVAGCAATPTETEGEGRQLGDTVADRFQTVKELAEQAQRTADQALRAAQESQSCCQENSEKIDRMFKKAMRK